MKYLLALFSIIIVSTTFAQQKEILIVGTMHSVPKVVKNSYKPLLKYSLKYKPDAIYVEYVRPADTLSLVLDTPDFVIKSDSLKQFVTINDERFEELDKTDLTRFTNDDFRFMTDAYLLKKDYANHRYFKYLKEHGIDGSEVPLRQETGDLTAKLAIALNLKYLHSMDDQKNRIEYQAAWEDCIESGVENGDNEINNKLGTKQYKSAIAPALLGRFGKHTNKMKSLNRLHKINSFRYIQNRNKVCDNATKYWDSRNLSMANNIGNQVSEADNIKNIVIVGAGHVIGLKEALEKNFPTLKVKTMYKL